MINKKAFSLIELSIVLIIIALLVAGIVGGKSLIDSAKNRALVNEILRQKQEIFIFIAKEDRYPGDINNIGKFGLNSGYYDSDFTSWNADAGFNINAFYAAYWDLYKAGISDFKPKTSSTKCTAFPCSKTIKQIYYYPRYNVTNSTTATHYLYNFRKDAMNLYLGYTGSLASKNIGLSPKTAKYLDEKIDEGTYNAGSLRYYCWKIINGTSAINAGETSYDDSITSRGKCADAYYDLGLK